MVNFSRIYFRLPRPRLSSSAVILLPLLSLGFAILAGRAAPSPAPTVFAGAASIDITPEYPVRLSGYGSRTKPSEGISQRLFAKALAFGKTENDTAVLITVDNLGVPERITEEVHRRVSAKVPFPYANLSICSSHTHNAPMLTGVAPFLFSKDIAPAEQAVIDRYTAELTDSLEKVALRALEDRRPASLAWGEGRAAFALNRRQQGGPVDHSLPILAVRGEDGALRAVVANYACHCTTLASNLHGGDWAGYAQEYMERDNPGCVAMVSIGCGADANPEPRNSLLAAQNHGAEIAAEVSRLLKNPMRPLPQGPVGVMSRFDLPFDTLPDRARWEALSREPGVIGYHAGKNLERIDRGETLPTTLPYSARVWTFGGDLAMVFLPGEVVVDYSLRLKSGYDKIWVTAYANDAPCYIPSRRIWEEGGYEGGGAMPYYDRPTRLGADTEELIFGQLGRLLPNSFRLQKMAGVDPPVSAEDSLKKIHTPPGFTVSLVAAEPEIVDPVAIDYGADGRLWVAEMRDYPAGLDGKGKPGGRVKVLADTDGDGRYEKATVFLDGLPFPTGLMTWRKGVLVAAAPDILYAEDTDGDGRADEVEKLFTGFATENFQARVNGLRRGMDGWIYGANGLLGGVIRSVATGRTVDIRGRDFRLNPDTGAFETVSGLSQQGRVRDDWDQWFGGDAGTFAWHYPMPEHYLRRNPEVLPRELRARVELSPRVFPASRMLERFNDPQDANRATGSSGGDFYRDTLLGADVAGDYFVNETVHNLTTRLKLTPDGVSFRGKRVTGEEESEFLASTDNWFRPVQARTGPDGGLWIVDMYRYVIEHPKWISADRLARLDVRAGDDRGRIYRVLPTGVAPRPMRDLTKLSPSELAAALDTPNGPVRDLIQERLVQSGDISVRDTLAALAAGGQLPQVRAQSLATMAGLGVLSPSMLESALADSHPRVRALAARMSEPFFNTSPALGGKAAAMASDPDTGVRYQLALSLGEWSAPLAGKALGQLAAGEMADHWFRTAVLTSAVPHAAEILEAVLASPPETEGRGELIGGLISTAVTSGNKAAAARVMGALAAAGAGEDWAFDAWANLIDALEHRGMKPEDLLAESATGDSALREKLEEVFRHSGARAFDESAAPEKRLAAMRLRGLDPALPAEDLRRMLDLIDTGASPELRSTALQALRRSSLSGLPALALQDWSRRSPGARAAFVSLLLSRDAWLADLLGALETGAVSGAEIPAPDRDRFVKNADPSIRERSEKVFAAFRPGRRAEVLAGYKGVADIPGDAARGAEVFRQNCAICHFARGLGHAVGPDLALFRDKAPPEFVEAILDPNAVIEPRFLNHVVEMNDGTFAAGVISSETANSLTLSQPAGQRWTVARRDIREIKPSSVSLMPEGFELSIPPPGMADLIAFLKGGKPAAFGTSTAESAAAARAAFGADQATGAAKIRKTAELMDYTSWLGVLPFAHCRLTNGESRMVWETAPAPEVLKPGETSVFRFAGGLGHHSQPGGAFTLTVNGTKRLEFGVELSDHVWTNGENTARMTYEVRETSAEDSNGVFSLELANTLLEPGKPATLEVSGSASGSNRWFGVYALSPGAVAPSENWKGDLADPTLKEEQRMEIIRRHPERSAEFLRELTDDLTPGTPEEYRRIPWIWNVTIAAGRRNHAEEMRALLNISLPTLDEPLHDWRSVVLGGGLINGITQAGQWPGPRLLEIIGTDTTLRARWTRALELAVVMVEDSAVPAGTRYDGLRMVALLPWETCRAQLSRYLAPDQNAELQQGAVSGLADIDRPEAAKALVEGFAGLTDYNKGFALDGLLRGPSQIDALLDAVEAGKITRKDLGESRITKLISLENKAQGERARKLLPPP